MSYPRVLALAAGVTATVVAWGLLVLSAIDFGRNARQGQGGWLLLVLAGVGAVACMFLAIVLAARMQALVRGDPTRPQGERPGDHYSDGGKRAAR